MKWSSSELFTVVFNVWKCVSSVYLNRLFQICACILYMLVFFCLQESEGFFLRALQINPNAASFHGNLGGLVQLKSFFPFSYLIDDIPETVNLKEGGVWSETWRGCVSPQLCCTIAGGSWSWQRNTTSCLLIWTPRLPVPETTITCCDAKWTSLNNSHPEGAQPRPSTVAHSFLFHIFDLTSFCPIWK